jgi:hypothetical protein
VPVLVKHGLTKLFGGPQRRKGTRGIGTKLTSRAFDLTKHSLAAEHGTTIHKASRAKARSASARRASFK